MERGAQTSLAGFRDEVRAFLDQALDEDLRAAARAMTSVYAPPSISLAWQAILHARGWAAPAWPVEYGGCGWSTAQRHLFATELALADAPPLSPMGLGMLGPVLIGHGSAEQKARFLPRILSGEDFWCQGYSEPGSGSDLASLRMSASDAGDDFVCSGQKIWTTHANVANWIFCLVRTASDGPPQRGVTFLLIDMTSPGIEVRPIVALTGEHVQNEVFFDEVRVPKANVVGAVDEGWAVAKHLMEFERGGRIAAPALRRRLGRLIANASAEPWVGRRLAEAAIRVDGLEAMEVAAMSRTVPDPLGLDASVLKILSTEASQHLTELALDMAGEDAAPDQPWAVTAGGPTQAGPARSGDAAFGPEWTRAVGARYFNDRAGSIYGGTNEIQRNIIAKALVNR